MCTRPAPYPREFRQDVIRVARSRKPGTGLKDVAADFGISESCLFGWPKRADVAIGVELGTEARAHQRTAVCIPPPNLLARLVPVSGDY